MRCQNNKRTEMQMTFPKALTWGLTVVKDTDLQSIKGTYFLVRHPFHKLQGKHGPTAAICERVPWIMHYRRIVIWAGRSVRVIYGPE